MGDTLRDGPEVGGPIDLSSPSLDLRLCTARALDSMCAGVCTLALAAVGMSACASRGLARIIIISHIMLLLLVR